MGKSKEKQEFTTVEDDHKLDGGASVAYTYDGTDYKSPETDPLTVNVIEAT